MRVYPIVTTAAYNVAPVTTHRYRGTPAVVGVADARPAAPHPPHPPHHLLLLLLLPQEQGRSLPGYVTFLF